MKKLIIFFVVLFQIISIFAQKKYTSADGAYGYEFSDDFSTMQSRLIDLDGVTGNRNDSDRKPTEITQFKKGLIPFWELANYEYIYLESEYYFILQNKEKQYIFVKEGMWSEYWKHKFLPGIYEATSEQKDFFNNYESFNLSLNNLDCWVSDSKTSGLNEFITIEINSKSSLFRIVNGFVDFENPENFEKYNRVKTIKAYDKNDNLIGTFNLKDDCSIQTFSLDVEVSFVRFEIAELYEGTLFSDVAITLLQMLK